MPRGRLKKDLWTGRAIWPTIWQAPPPEDFVEKLSSLSRMETVVVRSVCSGETRGETAYRLSISPQTVKNHITSIYAKLDLHGGTRHRMCYYLGRYDERLSQEQQSGTPLQRSG